MVEKNSDVVQIAIIGGGLVRNRFNLKFYILKKNTSFKGWNISGHLPS